MVAVGGARRLARSCDGALIDAFRSWKRDASEKFVGRSRAPQKLPATWVPSGAALSTVAEAAIVIARGSAVAVTRLMRCAGRHALG